MLHGCPREQNLVHHSGSGWLARPSPWGTFTSYSLPAFLAHTALGQIRPSCAAPTDGRLSPDSCRPGRMLMMAALGQNEPCHSLVRHGRSTSVSGPVGPAV